MNNLYDLNKVIAFVAVVLAVGVAAYAWVLPLPVTQVTVYVTNNVPPDDHILEQEEYMNDEITIINCDDNLYLDNRSVFNSLREKLNALYTVENSYPESYCELSDGTKLLSFLLVGSSDPRGAEQKVALLSTGDQIIRDTHNFSCSTVGDLGAPFVVGLENSVVKLECNSGDAGWARNHWFDLDLETFEFTVTRDTFEPVLQVKASNYGANCTIDKQCGELVGIDCGQAYDGPYYYVNNFSGDIVETCGGACMDRSDANPNCKQCPPLDWTCS